MTVILHAFAQISSGNCEGISETLAMSDDSTEVIILNLFVTYIVFLVRNLTARNFRLSLVIVTDV